MNVWELTVCAMVLAYVSAIQDISLSPVLMSGAGTSMPGPGEQRRQEEWGGTSDRAVVKCANHYAGRFSHKTAKSKPKTNQDFF